MKGLSQLNLRAGRGLFWSGVFLLVLVWRGGDTSADAGNAEVYPRLFERCLQCHGDIESASEAAYVHPPFRDGGCVECHDPHVADKPGLLWSDLGRRCRRCHSDSFEAIPEKDLHTPVRKGNCQGCHLGHSASGAGLLRQEGGALCYSCHEDVRAEAGEKYVHAVFDQGSCEACHSLHRGFTPLLAEGKSEGCLECHPTNESGMVDAHESLVSAESPCRDCHEAHASTNRALLHASAHKPVLEGDCEACHGSGEGRPEEGPAAARGTVEIDCFACHEEMRPTAEAEHGHAQLLTGKCSVCHNPHASPNQALLRSEAKDLCFGCHPEVRRELVAESVHEPAAAGECSACHLTHTSDNPHLLKMAGADLCRSCHPDHKHRLAHPYGRGWLDRRTGKKRDVLDPRTGEPLDCESCHLPHGSPHDHLLTHSGGRSLCIQCHEF